MDTGILLLATTAPSATALAQRSVELRDRGREAALALLYAPDEPLEDAGIAEIHRVPEYRVPSRLSRLLRGTESSGRGPLDRLFDRTQQDRWMRARVQRVEYLVALDQPAVYVAWQLARRQPGVKAAYGLAAVVADIDGRIALSRG